MGINLTGRRRKRLALGLLAAGLTGVTALGGAMAASADDVEIMRGPVRVLAADAEADIEGLEGWCRSKGKIPVAASVSPGMKLEDAEKFQASVTCQPDLTPDDTRHLDFFPSF